MWINSLYVNYLLNSELDNINFQKANYVNKMTHPLLTEDPVRNVTQNPVLLIDSLWKHGKDILLFLRSLSWL